MRQVLKAILGGVLSVSVVVAACGGVSGAEVQATDAVASAAPSTSPSVSPSAEPSASPSVTPSATPSVSPSAAPSASPSATPVVVAPKVPVIAAAMVVDEVGVAVEQQVCDGVEIQVVNKATNKVVATQESNKVITSISGIPRKAVYYVQVRAYSFDATGQKLYSDWSEKAYIVAQPSISKNKKNIKKKAIVCKWNKIAGANSYTVYARKRGASKWVKVKTTSKTSYTIKKLKGKKIDTKKNNYEMRVTASAKVDGKKYTSDGSAYVYTYSYVTYR